MKLWLIGCWAMVAATNALLGNLILNVPTPPLAQRSYTDGLAFTVTADRDLSIAAFRVMVNTGSNVADNRQARVYTRSGVFTSAMIDNGTGWTEVDRRSFATDLSNDFRVFNLDSPVVVLGGTTQSFIIGFRDAVAGNGLATGTSVLGAPLVGDFLTLQSAATTWSAGAGAGNPGVFFFGNTVVSTTNSFYGEIRYQLVGGGGGSAGQAAASRAAAVAANRAQQQLQRQQQRVQQQRAQQRAQQQRRR